MIVEKSHEHSEFTAAIDERIVVIGLGYVGLPISLEFSKVCAHIVGYDIDQNRVNELSYGDDRTLESTRSELASSNIRFTSDPSCVKDASVIVVTVPTPIDKTNRPDLTPLRQACEQIGGNLTKDTIIVFESTVYPTVTEELCGPILEQASGLVCGVDFKLAYSPERVSPGDSQRSLQKIKKVVAGQDEETLEKVASLYRAIIPAGVHLAPSITVAETAKVIENTQRDLNIALMNELALICDGLKISTTDVIETAATKWNFHKYSPGLVGGHCIGVDPYYLTAKAEELGRHPEVILSGRRVNDSMGEFVGNKAVRLLAQNGHPVKGASIGILGLTFKENVPDFRNSKVFDIISELNDFEILPFVHDPYMSLQTSTLSAKMFQTDIATMKDLHCLILAVPHDQYLTMSELDLVKFLVPGGIFLDVKSRFPDLKSMPEVKYWAL